MKKIKTGKMNSQKYIYSFIIFALVLSLSHTSMYAQKDKQYIRNGNKLYHDNKFEEAELKYRKAIEINDKNIKADYNLADALYKKESYSEAAGKFEFLVNKVEDEKLAGDIAYNLGNSYFKVAEAATKSGDPQQMQLSMEHYKKALESYKNAMKLNSKDNDARYNYELAKRSLQQQQQQQQQQQNQDQQDKKDQENKDKQDQQQNKDGQDKKDQENKDKQDQQQNKDGQDKQDKQDKQQGQQDQENKDKQQQQPKPQQGKKMSKEQAEQMLKAMQQKEKGTLKKMKTQKSKKVKIEKNW